MTLAPQLLALTFVALLSGCRSAVSKGRSDAEADLKAGKLAVEQFGMPSPVYAEAQRLLRVRYGIESRQVAACIVSTEIAQHAEGYNGVMKAEIAKRFGEDVFDRTYEEAKKR